MNSMRPIKGDRISQARRTVRVLTQAQDAAVSFECAVYTNVVM
jgi:hypothetical protein